MVPPFQPRRGHIPLSNPPPPPPSRSDTASLGSGYADVSEMDKYQLVANIGKGSFGVISKVQRIEDKKEFALKSLDYSKMTEKDKKQMLAEVNILESLKHRNIVQLYQKIKDPHNEKIHIVMEYCSSGDLGTLIRKASRARTPLHEDRIWSIFLQITLALHYCHWPNERANSPMTGRTSGSNEAIGKYQILHRDLKPENVFMSDDFVKLGDFGLSKDMGTSMFTDTYVGTPLYMPPEILSENRYDTKSDIWSLGCVLHEMCTFSSPFATAQTQQELISLVKSGRLPPIPNTYSPTLGRLIRAMLQLNPTKRPTTSDLLEMDEMRVHRMSFRNQVQANLINARKTELEAQIERVRARDAQVAHREADLVAREANLQAREAKLEAKEEEHHAAQDQFNRAAETLRTQWDRFREEKAAFLQREEAFEARLRADGSPPPRPPPVRRASGQAARRPILEERNTAPIPSSSRLPRMSMAYDDTPSKIPVAPDSPNPLDARFSSLSVRHATPLRRNNTKSMGNLQAEARAQAQAQAAFAEETHVTPARPTMPPVRPGMHRKRSSIGSPDEIARVRDCEDVSMRTFIASPAINTPGLRGRRSFSALAAADDGTSSSWSGGSRPPTRQASGSSSGSGSDRDRDRDRGAERAKIPSAPSFVYRETASPAKWKLDDPNLPSPFIRRTMTAPIPSAAESRAAIERNPLGSILPNPPVASAAAVGPIPLRKPSAGPRTGKSGTGALHRDVLRANAGRTSAEGPGTAAGGRTRPSVSR